MKPDSLTYEESDMKDLLPCEVYSNNLYICL